LLLTGCPLTDHYRIQEDQLGAAGSHAGADSNAGSSAGDEPSSAAGASSSVGGALEMGGMSNGAAGDGTTCSSACNAWIGMATPPALLVARSKAASVALGEAVFIWGGLDGDGAALDNGAIYYPATDTWTYLPRDPGSPSARIMATAVWTGSASNKVIVYGGTDASGGTVYRDGSVYDVHENSWAPLATSTAISKRSAAYGYWDGTRAVFFGGLNATPAVVPGADRFDLETETWTTSTTNGDPGLLGFSATAFDGSVMYLQGGVIGSTRQDKVFAYTSSTDKWATLTTGPSLRTGAFGAWDGSRFVVWGGQDDVGLRDDGKTLSGTTWSEMSAPSTLSARRIAFRRSGWAFSVKPGVVALIGGQISISGSSDPLATDGAIYDVQREEWTEIPSWPSRESHEYGIGVWTGEQFVLWGGRAQNLSTLTGERWVP
jgi:N-acetylneuraminic acid mutarotase